MARISREDIIIAYLSNLSELYGKESLGDRTTDLETQAWVGSQGYLTASYQLSMAWFNTINLVENVTVKMRDLNMENPIVSVDMTEAFKRAGYDASLIKDGMRIQSFDIYSVNWDSDFVFEPVFRQNSRILNLELSGKIVPGASNAQMIKFTVSPNPSYVYREFTATQIRMDVTINLRII